MDRTSLIDKLKARKKLLAGLGGVAVIALTAGAYFARKPAEGHDPHAKAGRHGSAHAKAEQAEADEEGEEDEEGDEGHKVASEGHESGDGSGHGASHAPAHATGHAAEAEGFFATYAKAFRSVQDKVESLRQIELENERLRLENTHLRLALENANFTKAAQSDSRQTATTGKARDLGSIHYTMPTDLAPSQLYTLGVSYFKAHEDEKAAVIFTFLTGLKDNDAFRTAKNHLMTGVAWYRLDNYATADKYFDLVLQSAPSMHDRGFQAHARLWKALVATRLGKQGKAQFWLTELIDHHPRSAEAAWVNAPHPAPKAEPHTEAHRGVASEHH